jgi:hypothetical protein
VATVTSLDVTCPRCLARPGKPCGLAGFTHPERFDAATAARGITGLFRALADAVTQRKDGGK